VSLIYWTSTAFCGCFNLEYDWTPQFAASVRREDKSM